MRKGFLENRIQNKVKKKKTLLLLLMRNEMCVCVCVCKWVGGNIREVWLGDF